MSRPTEYARALLAARRGTAPPPVVHLLTLNLDTACGHDGHDFYSSVLSEVTCRACRKAAVTR